ncbi:MAG: SGNH hydrolase domain-containing protein, partial [Actinomycetota bacterium]
LMAWLFEPGRDPSRLYYGTDTRAQSLLVGAALGAVLARRAPSERARHHLHRLAPAAVAVLAVMWATTTDTAPWLYRGGFLLAAILVALVIASVTDPDRPGPVGRSLAWPPLRALGVISYGVYLWHWPVYVYLSPDRTGIDGTALLVLRLAVTVAVATVSYAFVEQPIRAGTFRVRRPRVLLPAGAAALVGAIVLATAGAVPTEFRPASAGAIEAVPVTVPAAPRVMIVGDSVAYSMAPGLRAEADRRGWRLWNVAVPGCGLSNDIGEHWDGVGWRPHETRCDPPWRDRWPLQVAAFRPDVVVMLVGTQDIFDRRINGQIVSFDTLAGTMLARADLDEAISILSAGGAKVVVLTTPYHVLGWPMRIDESRSSMYAPWTDRYNSIQRSVVDAAGGRAELRDLNRLLGPDGVWTDTVAGIRVRNRDRMHLSPEGAAFVASWLAPTLIPERAGAATSATPPPPPPG